MENNPSNNRADNVSGSNSNNRADGVSEPSSGNSSDRLNTSNQRARSFSKLKSNVSNGKNNKLIFGIIAAIIIAIIIIIVVIFTNNKQPEPVGPAYIENLSKMSQQEILDWCGKNNVACSISYEFKEGTEKDQFISQSVKPGDYLPENDRLQIIFSRGPIPKGDGFEDAVKAAELEANAKHISKIRLLDHLKSDFSEEAAKWAVDNAPIDWETICLARAADYYRGSAHDFDAENTLRQYQTKSEIKDALTRDGFTETEIKFALNLLNSTVSAEVAE